MCDGKLASKRDVVILSIKPKRPDYPSSQKVVPVSELLQEWDKLDAYYRGQLLKLQKSFSKSTAHSNKNHHQSIKNSRHSSPNNQNKVNNNSKYPVNKKNSSSLSSNQFTELFGDENLFNPASAADNNNNNHNHRSSNRNHNHHSKNKSNKLLHSRSLNSLFSDEDDDDESLNDLSLPPPKSNSRTSSLSSVNENLLVSIPVLSVQKNQYNRRKYCSDGDDDEGNDSSGVSEEEDEVLEDEAENFLSVPRDNFQVQYGTKQKTRVALLEHTASVSPRFIVPIRVAPYKPPAAQGLNGIQIQKILYHKNDKVNYASPTTTSARTPDKPPDNNFASPPSLTHHHKSAKVSSENNSPINSTVSPRSGTTLITVTPPVTAGDNNNATPKQTASRTPELSSPKSDQGYKSSSSSKLSSPPVNSTTGNTTHNHQHLQPQQNTLKRPISLTESYSSAYSSSSSTTGHGKKQRLGSSSSSIDGISSDRSPSGYNFLPVTSSSNSSNSNNNYAFSSQSKSSSCSSLFDGDALDVNDHHHSPRSRHSSTSSSASSSSRLNLNATDNATIALSSPPPSSNSHKKLNIIQKNPLFVKPLSSSSSSSAASGGDRDHSVFLAPAAVSITDRIIKKASRPQPEILERQRRRRLESDKRKSYAMKMGDEHEERESIDLSMKSFEMIWNVPLLSPLRSP